MITEVVIFVMLSAIGAAALFMVGGDVVQNGKSAGWFLVVLGILIIISLCTVFIPNRPAVKMSAGSFFI